MSQKGSKSMPVPDTVGGALFDGARGGKLRPGGSLPTKTGGGQLSGYHNVGLHIVGQGVASGATRRPCPGLRQWPHSEFSLHADPEAPPIGLTAVVKTRLTRHPNS